MHRSDQVNEKEQTVMRPQPCVRHCAKHLLCTISFYTITYNPMRAAPLLSTFYRKRN